MPTTVRRTSTALFAAALLAFAATAVSAALVTTAAQAATLGDRTLRTGAKGSDVKALQRLLNAVGIKTATDGEFGSGTKAAVIRFQRWSKLEPSGSVGPHTVEALNAASAAGKTVSTKTSAGGASMDLTTEAEPDPADAPVTKARLASDGTAVAPANAPDDVKEIIDAGNKIAKKPYVYGGGHGSWNDSGYDCSGSVSYALHGAGLLKESMASGDFMSWGKSGKGKWVTIYANGGHMYMYVAGLRFDTSGANPSRWQKASRSNSGFTVRHIAGL